MSSLLDRDDGAFLQDARAVGKNRRQPFKYVLCSRIVEAEDDHTRLPALRECRDLTEIKVESEDRATFRNGLREYFPVGQSLETLIAEMQGIVALLAQPSSNMNTHPHIQEEPHVPPPHLSWSARVNLFLGQPCGIRESLPNVFALEVRIPCQHFLEICSVGDLAHDQRHWDPHTSNRGPAAEDLWIECDAVELHSGTSVASYSSPLLRPAIVKSNQTGAPSGDSEIKHRSIPPEFHLDDWEEGWRVVSGIMAIREAGRGQVQGEMMAKTAAHKWEFRSRLQRRAFGWRSQPAIKRTREAVSEIKKIARKDRILAAEGGVLFLEKVSPALEAVDSSSGAIGTAVNNAVKVLANIIATAPASDETREKWLERLFDAHAADQIPYIELLAEHWGELCASPEIASRWADRLRDATRLALNRDRSLSGHFHGTSACLSSLYAAGRHDELITVLQGESFWPYKRWAVKALLAGVNGDQNPRKSGE
jgi:NAD(P)-dependent dehydrogenase (short-subunit alcohol dehydrogenase family)